ncbi:MAG: dihydroxy-acid dehydratase, partial [Burkholderiales bacterium]
MIAVTERIRACSSATRPAYLRRIDEAAKAGPLRKSLSCTNLAHGMAALPPEAKARIRDNARTNIAIVSSYNDVLSAHQPFERFPQILKAATNEAGAVAQFAGGVPAMCDGVTQGQPGMELSLFSRDVIAMS